MNEQMMTEQKPEKTFEPITSQEEFDERIKARLAREREKWEKENEIPGLRARIEEKDAIIAEQDREIAEARDAGADAVEQVNLRSATGGWNMRCLFFYPYYQTIV